MITGINESNIWSKDTTCECKCRFDWKKCNSNHWWNKNKCWCECKKHVCEKDYTWNRFTSSCENEIYLASLIDNSVILSDEIIDADSQDKLFDEA